MEETYLSSGKTTIASNVLLTIAQLTTLSVSGVSRLGTPRGKGMELLMKRGQEHEGVKIDHVIDDLVYADIYVVLQNDVNVRDVSHLIQRDVARAIPEMVGMPIGHVNIHVEDIDFDMESDNL